jgi:TolA-binding protein
MSSDPRFSELMRELAEDAPPAEGQAQARARRSRTVAHLRGLQARSAVRREMSASWRNRLLVAAALLIPSGALGASLLPWSPFVHTSQIEPAAAPAASTVAQGVRRPSKRVRTAPSTAVAEAMTSEQAAATPEAAPPAPQPPAEATAKSSIPSHSPNVVRDTSTLAEENRLMQAALAARRAGQNARAVQLLTELLTSHPGSPLAQNAEVERFRALLRSGDQQSAARQANAYLSQYPNGMAADEARKLAGSAPEPINERSF